MSVQFVRGFRGAVRFDVVGACDELGVDRADTPRDQVGVLQITHANGAIIALGNQVNEAIAVAGLHVQLRMTASHFRQHRGEVCRPERQRHCYAQATAQGAGGQDGFLGDVDFAADSGGVIAERRAGLGE
ncbi:hypothetical protein D3C81_1804500 [compost metagenome]